MIQACYGVLKLIKTKKNSWQYIFKLISPAATVHQSDEGQLASVPSSYGVRVKVLWRYLNKIIDDSLSILTYINWDVLLLSIWSVCLFGRKCYFNLDHPIFRSSKRNFLRGLNFSFEILWKKKVQKHHKKSLHMCETWRTKGQKRWIFF